MSIIHPLSVQKTSLKEYALIFTDPKYSKTISVFYKQKIEVPMLEKPYKNIPIESIYIFISFNVKIVKLGKDLLNLPKRKYNSCM